MKSRKTIDIKKGEKKTNLQNLVLFCETIFYLIIW